MTQTPPGEAGPPAYSPTTIGDIEQGVLEEKQTEVAQVESASGPEVIRVHPVNHVGSIQEEARTGRTSVETLVPLEPSVNKLSRHSSVSRFGGLSVNSRE